MKVVLDEGAFLPSSAHKEDAGYDLYAPYDVVVPGCSMAIERSMFGDMFGDHPIVRLGSATIDTGVHVEIPEGYVGMIKSKSGLNVKYSLTAEGVIDCGYTGSIVVKIYNHGPDPYTFHRGDKITQLVIMPILKPELEIVNSLEDTARGDGGFGSTGK